ncbi:UNVERIFIED_CONTAM: Histone-lysine N-methyltransferase SUV39H1 [Trichonephila clavipes]
MILTSEEAEMRGNIYDYVERSYLFDLDYGEENCKYTVDAGHYGNAAHFINHSCNPNLHVFAVWINNQDPQLPRLAFFAKKKINRGEELTFDYKMVKNHDKFGRQNSRLEERIPCMCNSSKCRNYLF